MIVKLEKQSLRYINRYVEEPYKTVFKEWWIHFILNFNRINPDNDKIVITTSVGHISFEYENKQNFTWYFSRSTYSKLLTKYGATLSFKDNKSKRTITISSEQIKPGLNVHMYVKDILLEDKSNDTLIHIRNISNGLDCNSCCKEIIFETLLNIAQHEYRVHEKLEIGDLFNQCYTYAKNEIYCDKLSNGHICGKDIIVMTNNRSNLINNSKFVNSKPNLVVYYDKDVDLKYVTKLKRKFSKLTVIPLKDASGSNVIYLKETK